MAGKILVTARSFGRGPKNFNYFTDRGYQLIENPYYHRILREEELCELLADADGCLIGLEEMTEAVYRAAPKLVVAQKMGIGVDNMAVEAATRHGVAVTNVPSATVGSVADLTFGLLLCISKKIVYTNRRVMQGMWPMDFSNDMCGKTLGIIGFGRIGQAVARRAKGFGMRILAFDFFPDRQMAAQLCVELVEEPGALLEASDYVTLHVPKTEQTTGMIGQAQLARMKRGSYLVNASRGGVVDEDALYKALVSGQLAGAACDVLEHEPPVERPKLFDCENFVVTSHSGGNSIEAAEQIARTAAENIMAVIEGRECDYIVNREQLRNDTAKNRS